MDNYKSWNCEEVTTVDYSINIQIELHHLNPPKDTIEHIERQQMQVKIDKMAFDFLQSIKNKESLANLIFGNKGLVDWE